MPDQSPEISKDFLYGRYHAGEERRQKLAMKAAHKALDIPDDDDMQIKADRTTVNGVGAKGLIGVALAAGLPIAALSGALLLRPQATPAVTQPPPVVKEFDAVTEQQQPDGQWLEIKRERLK